MEPREVMAPAELRSECETLSRAEFAARHPNDWLVVGTPVERSVDGIPRFNTARANLKDLRPPAEDLTVHGVVELIPRTSSETPQSVSIGRSSSNDVILRDDSISKVHARIQAGPGSERRIADADSRNGTLINGERVDPTKSRPLSCGDVVQLGNLTTRLVSSEQLYDLLQEHFSG